MENSGHSHEHEHRAPAASSSLMNALNPKQTFALGLIGGFLVLCTLGFFVLLSMYFRGGMPVARNNAPSVAAGDNNAVDDGGQVDPSTIQVRPVDEKTDHILGNKNAKVTIVEYSDFECPFCQRFYQTIKQVMDKYGKDVRFVYRHFPLSFHPQAMPAAIASECASEQGKFWEMYDKLFGSGVVSTGSYTEYAKAIGLNTAKFDACVKDQKYLSVIQDDQTDGQNAGVQGTPYSVILGPKGEKIPVSGAQPFEAVDAALQQVL